MIRPLGVAVPWPTRLGVAAGAASAVLPFVVGASLLAGREPERNGWHDADAVWGWLLIAAGTLVAGPAACYLLARRHLSSGASGASAVTLLLVVPIALVLAMTVGPALPRSDVSIGIVVVAATLLAALVGTSIAARTAALRSPP